MNEWEVKRAKLIAPLCLPSLLRYLIIQPLNFQGGFNCGTGAYRLRKLWERLAALGETGLDPMVLRLEDSMNRMQYCERAYEDWLDRVGCGEGCWKVRGPEKRE